MPVDYKLYPPYWKQFSAWVRFERAKGRCEECRNALRPLFAQEETV